MNNNTLKIEKGIPIPDARGGRSKSEFRLTIEAMQIGESIVVSKNQRLHSSSAAKSAGKKIVTRVMPEGTTRLWVTEILKP
jgi:hypothetical protein